MPCTFWSPPLIFIWMGPGDNKKSLLRSISGPQDSRTKKTPTPHHWSNGCIPFIGHSNVRRVVNQHFTFKAWDLNSLHTFINIWLWLIKTWNVFPTSRQCVALKIHRQLKCKICGEGSRLEFSSHIHQHFDLKDQDLKCLHNILTIWRFEGL